MSEIIFSGPFSACLESFIELKRAVGYNYETEARHLMRFDRFLQTKHPLAIALTKEIITEWCAKKSYEAQANQCSRASIIRQFAKYLDSLEMQAYILPKGYYPTGKQYVPYIYTQDELTRFFAETDRCHVSSECPCRHLIFPIFFRMIYTCGLRASEARLLKVADVDLKNGILTIDHSKNDRSRLVPMPESLIERCRQYAQEVHPFPDPEAYFFPALGGKPMTLINVYRNFRRFLWRAGISHKGKGQGPRVHDFRHSYAVHCLKRWVEQGKDLMAYLPVLKTYMGHDSFEGTAYYLRLTADVFPNITAKLEAQFPDIIPQLEGGADDEAD